MSVVGTVSGVVCAAPLVSPFLDLSTAFRSAAFIHRYPAMGVDKRAIWRRETFAFKKRPPPLTEAIGLPDGTRARGVDG